MLYKIIDQNISIKNTGNSVEKIIPLNGIVDIMHSSYNLSNNFLALSGSKDKKNYSLFIYDIGKSMCLIEFPGKYYDLYWLSDNILFYNDGKSIISLDVIKNERKKLFKFSTIEYSPVYISINKDKNKLCFLKAKDDYNKISIFDITKEEVKIMKYSCYQYCWHDQNNVLFNFNNGIKMLNINLEKSSSFIDKIYDFAVGYECSEYATQINDILKLLNSDSLFISNIGNPKQNNNRIYFEIFIHTKKDKRIGVFSLNHEKKDLKIHFLDKIGLLRNYYLFNDPNLICVDIVANNLIKEKIEPGYKYYKDNEYIDMNGYLPLYTLGHFSNNSIV